jgi:hypothetical protein
MSLNDLARSMRDMSQAMARAHSRPGCTTRGGVQRHCRNDMQMIIGRVDRPYIGNVLFDSMTQTAVHPQITNALREVFGARSMNRSSRCSSTRGKPQHQATG